MVRGMPRALIARYHNAGVVKSGLLPVRPAHGSDAECSAALSQRKRLDARTHCHAWCQLRRLCLARMASIRAGREDDLQQFRLGGFEIRQNAQTFSVCSGMFCASSTARMTWVSACVGKQRPQQSTQNACRIHDVSWETSSSSRIVCVEFGNGGPQD